MQRAVFGTPVPAGHCSARTSACRTAAMWGHRCPRRSAWHVARQRARMPLPAVDSQGKVACSSVSTQMHICLIHVEQEPTQAGFHTGVQEVGPPPHRRSLGGAEESENGSAGLKKRGVIFRARFVGHQYLRPQFWGRKMTPFFCNRCAGFRFLGPPWWPVSTPHRPPLAHAVRRRKTRRRKE